MNEHLQYRGNAELLESHLLVFDGRDIFERFAEIITSQFPKRSSDGDPVETGGRSPSTFVMPFSEHAAYHLSLVGYAVREDY